MMKHILSRTKPVSLKCMDLITSSNYGISTRVLQSTFHRAALPLHFFSSSSESSKTNIDITLTRVNKDHSHHSHDHSNDHNGNDIDDDEMEQEDMFVEAHASLGHDKIEWGGPRRGGRFEEPTRYGDWERKGRCTDF